MHRNRVLLLDSTNINSQSSWCIKFKFSGQMHNNLKITLLNCGCTNFSFKKVMVFHTTTAQPCCQARRQDLAAGGAKNQKGGHIFKTQYWMYAATDGPIVKWGHQFQMGGRAPLPPHWRRPCLLYRIKISSLRASVVTKRKKLTLKFFVRITSKFQRWWE